MTSSQPQPSPAQTSLASPASTVVASLPAPEVRPHGMPRPITFVCPAGFTAHSLVNLEKNSPLFARVRYSPR